MSAAPGSLFSLDGAGSRAGAVHELTIDDVDI